MAAEFDPADFARLVTRLRFRDLRLLVALRDGGSLRAAASVLNLTQPALSKSLGEIERAFGTALFVRNPRGLVPTPAGDIGIRGATLLLRELVHVQQEVSAVPATTVLRVGAPPFLAQNYLPQVFKRLADSAVPTRIQLWEDRVPMLVDALIDGRLDGLVTTHPAETAYPAGSTLHYENLFEVEFVVVASSAHALAGVRRIDWHRLAGERWIMPASNSMVRRMMEEAFRRQGMYAPSPVIESTVPVTNLQLVAAGLGIAAVPRTSLDASALTKDVVVLRLAPPLPRIPVALMHRGGSENPRLDLLRTALELK